MDRTWFMKRWLLCAYCFNLVTSESTETIQTMAPGDQEIQGWGVNVRRVTSEYIDPTRDTTIISGREICRNPETEIVIVVESTPGAYESRNAIRSSWGNFTGLKVKVGFIIGFGPEQSLHSTLSEESAVYKDIIEESFVEGYFNLTLKGIAILKWFVRNCPNAKFLMKADDDTFVDVRLLIRRLANFRNSKGVLRGYLCSNFDRDDRLWSKWYCPKYLYKYDKYPDFLQGSAYYMSRDVAVKLFAAAMSIPVLHLEDVYVTGLCAARAKVKPERDEGVEYLFGGDVSYCLHSHIITCNRVIASELQWVLSERNRLIHYSDADSSIFIPHSYDRSESAQRNYSEEIEIMKNLSLKNAPKTRSEVIGREPLGLGKSTSSIILDNQAYVVISFLPVFQWLH